MNKQYTNKFDVLDVVKRILLMILVCSWMTACNENGFEKLATNVASEGISTNDNSVVNPGSQPDTSVADIFEFPTAEPVVFPLMAGQNIEVGTVTITNSETAIIVVFETVDGWGITETHVDVALDYSGLHTNGAGNPIPGRFDQQTCHPDPVNRVVHTIDDLQWEPGTPIYVATHAVVTSQQQGTETAWAGDQDFPGNNWATYFGYTTQEVVQDNRGHLQFSQAVYEAYELGRNRTYVLEITVERVGGSSGDISATYQVTGGTATYDDNPSLSDYGIDSLSGTLEFPDGVTQQIITILIFDDNEYEVPSETIELELSESCCLGDQGATTVIIVDDDELS